MYKASFGFCEAPFENKLDQRFLYLGRDHGEVLAALLYFMREEKGLAMVCGDVGTGKTMLLHGFLNKLPNSVQPILITNPMVNYRELLGYIASSLGIPWRGKTLLELLDLIKETLTEAHGQGKTCILIIDEAHLLSDASLEQIRLLSNLETAECKLMQILLVGQYELSHRLNLPKFRQLRQRININRFLSPLSAAETLQYVEYRLGKAGSQLDRCFTPNCQKLIWKLTGGVPRCINQLCDTALLICLGEGRKQVDPKTLKKAQDALQTDRIFTPRHPFLPWPRSLAKQGKFWVPALAGLLVLSLWGLLYSASFQAAIGKVWQVKASSSQVEVSSNIASGEGSAAGGDTPAKSLTTAAVAASAGSAGSAVTATQASVPLSPPKHVEIPATTALTQTPDEAEKLPDLTKDSSEAKIKGSSADGREVPAAPEPAKQAAVEAATRVEASRPWQVEVESNDTLSGIARRWFPDQEELGLLALVLANPQTLSADQIFAGQQLNLPVIDADQTIRLQDGGCYALFGEYPSIRGLQRAISSLSRHKVRYAIMNNLAAEEGASYQVLIGPYGNRPDLEQALLQVKKGQDQKR